MRSLPKSFVTSGLWVEGNARPLDGMPRRFLGVTLGTTLYKGPKPVWATVTHALQATCGTPLPLKMLFASQCLVSSEFSLILPVYIIAKCNVEGTRQTAAASVRSGARAGGRRAWRGCSG
jgi:hypothetical protein